MRYHPSSFFYVLLLLLWSCSSDQPEQREKKLPQPTEIKANAEEGSEGQLARLKWIESMHKTAPGTNWRSKERENASMYFQNRNKAETRGIETFADGALSAEWIERGSNNLAGSVEATWYDVKTDDVFVIGAGGTLFTTKLANPVWKPVNQQVRLLSNSLQGITVNNQLRLIAFGFDGQALYSDDRGASWTTASGLPNKADFWGGPNYLQGIFKGNQRLLFCMSKLSYWDKIKIYVSEDNGVSWRSLFTTDQNDYFKARLTTLKSTNTIYFAVEEDSENALYEINDQLQVTRVGTLPEDLNRIHITLAKIDNDITCWTYNSNNTVFRSKDLGKTWTSLGTLEENPWDVGLFVTEARPKQLLMGAVNSYRSIDEGNAWTIVNPWWEYYNDIQSKLHADIMYYSEWADKNGRPFVLISNHGGLYISFDNCVTNQNIGMDGLNVGQFYDVATDPLDRSLIYMGTQDQGFQRMPYEPNDKSIAIAEQVISGDYGQIVFSTEGKSLWTVYPGGSVSYYRNPQISGPTAWYEINSSDETVWLPPMMDNPLFPEGESAFIAGGNPSGASGSYIIQLDYNETDNTISAQNLPYNFNTSGAGVLTTFRYSPVNIDQWYACTTEGFFFYSSDAGNTWKRSQQLPGGQYLYGAAIWPSRVNANTVYYGGSGYSNPGAFVSRDGGKTFQAITDGLPGTLIIDMAGTPDDQFIFAATEAGPFVYHTSVNKWYPLAGASAPNTTWWSVDYLEDMKTVRFGTYGRGVWDFAISEVVANKDLIASTVKIWPNPAKEILYVEAAVNTPVAIYNQSGTKVLATRCREQNTSIAVQHLPPGIYFVNVGNQSKRLIIQ